MRTRVFYFALLLRVACTPSSPAQIALPPSSPPEVTLAQSSPEVVRVYPAGAGVTAPELLPHTFATADCEAPVSGEIALATIVDVTGVARNIIFLHPLGNDLDRVALETLSTERFKPGEINGSPAAVAESVSMKLQACPVHPQTGSGPTYLGLHSLPELHLSQTDIYPSEVTYSGAIPNGGFNGGVFNPGPDVSPPIMLLATPMIEIGSGTRAKYQGEVVLSLIVDTFGMPLNVRVTHPLGMGLDQKAIDAIRLARFKPALWKGRRPVPVIITVAVQCRIY